MNKPISLHERTLLVSNVCKRKPFRAIDALGKEILPTDRDIRLADKYLKETEPLKKFASNHPIDVATRKATVSMCKSFGLNPNEFLLDWPQR